MAVVVEEDEEEGRAVSRKVVVEGMINVRKSWNSIASHRVKAAKGKSGAWRNCRDPSCI